jgi:tRNA modification GTPase
MNEINDTIAAIATAAGVGGISVIRVSGSRSMEIADCVFNCRGKKPSERKAGTFVHGRVVSSGGERLDDAILLIYRAPHSYTCEDVIEIQGHGGTVNARRILQTVLDAGARPAEPGEFTKRAFLNGRLDLVQAEAVADVVSAKSDHAARSAMEQLDGRLSSELADVYDVLVDVGSDIEATLDFEQDELPERIGADICGRLKTVRMRLEQLLATWQDGHVLRDGLLVVIAGQPNAGKSTLLNKLLGKDRAIVADMPGTTRDVIEEQMLIEGVMVRLVDTAGLRETECAVERDGVGRATEQMRKADVVLYVIDGSKSLSKNDISYLSDFGGKCLVVVNKKDLGSAVADRQLPGGRYVRCSLESGEGFAEVVGMLSASVSKSVDTDSHSVISERHRYYIQNALNALNKTNADALDLNSEQASLCSDQIKMAVEFIGTILGRVYTEDMLDQIFKKFCVGK